MLSPSCWPCLCRRIRKEVYCTTSFMKLFTTTLSKYYNYHRTGEHPACLIILVSQNSGWKQEQTFLLARQQPQQHIRRCRSAPKPNNTSTRIILHVRAVRTTWITSQWKVKTNSNKYYTTVAMSGKTLFQSAKICTELTLRSFITTTQGNIEIQMNELLWINSKLLRSQDPTLIYKNFCSASAVFVQTRNHKKHQTTTQRTKVLPQNFAQSLRPCLKAFNCRE